MLFRCSRIPAGFDKHNLHMKRVQPLKVIYFIFAVRVPPQGAPPRRHPTGVNTPESRAPPEIPAFPPIGSIPANPIKSMTYKNHTFFGIHGDAEIRIFYKNFGLPYLANLAG